MRICLYTETALPKMGGQEFVVDALARQFASLGHEVVVLAPRPRPPWRIDDAKFPYRVERHPRFISTRRLVNWYSFWLRRCHRRHRFDVLHCHGVYPPGYLAAMCRNSLGVPTVITSHGGDIREGNVRLTRPVLVERYVQALEGTDVLVAISRFTRESLLRLCPNPRTMVDIPNGVDLEPFASAAGRPASLDAAIRPGEYLLFLGRLKHRKGVDVLLEALALVPSSGSVQLVVAGDGEERSTLEALAARWGLQHRVRFVSAVFGPEKTYLLQNALATVIPSRLADAFPLVVLESFAAGVPVVGSRVPGLEDLIEEGKTGWQVPPESPRDLAQVLARLLNSPDLLRSLSPAVRAKAAEFSWPAIAHRHLHLYGTLVSNERFLLSA
jgi:glycosyltransferase involved in cell wall biosynthesis